MFRRCLNKYMFHKWSNWTYYKDIVYYPNTNVVWWKEVRKERICSRCNDLQDKPTNLKEVEAT